MPRFAKVFHRPPIALHAVRAAFEQALDAVARRDS